MSWRSRSRYREGCRAAAFALVALAARPAHAEDSPPLEVTASAAPRRRDPGRVTLSTEEAGRVAGTGGDPLEAVGSLPGLARPAFDGGKLIVWGAAPGDTRVYVDGVEVPALYHGGGLRGVLSGDLVQSLDLVPGAYGAEHGRALGGLVRLTTRELPAEGVHASAGADLLDASATVTAAAFDGKLRVALAGRVSYLDRILAGVVSPTVGELVPIPRYHDMAAKVALTLREDEALELLLLGSGDALDCALVSPDPGAVHRESTTSSFYRALLRYTRTLADGTAVVVTPFFGQDEQSYDASYGSHPRGAGRDLVALRRPRLGPGPLRRGGHRLGGPRRARIRHRGLPRGVARHPPARGRSLRLRSAPRGRRQRRPLDRGHPRRRALRPRRGDAGPRQGRPGAARRRLSD